MSINAIRFSQYGATLNRTSNTTNNGADVLKRSAGVALPGGNESIRDKAASKIGTAASIAGSSAAEQTSQNYTRLRAQVQAGLLYAPSGETKQPATVDKQPVIDPIYETESLPTDKEISKETYANRKLKLAYDTPLPPLVIPPKSAPIPEPYEEVEAAPPPPLVIPPKSAPIPEPTDEAKASPIRGLGPLTVDEEGTISHSSISPIKFNPNGPTTSPVTPVNETGQTGVIRDTRGTDITDKRLIQPIKVGPGQGPTPSGPIILVAEDPTTKFSVTTKVSTVPPVKIRIGSSGPFIPYLPPQPPAEQQLGAPASPYPGNDPVDVLA